MATYYIKTGGNDSLDGKSDVNAWATINKVNSYWASGLFAPGDNIYFRKGDTFYGTLVVNSAGVQNNPITIGSYGTGQNPTLTGFTTVTGWTNYGGGIYSKAITAQSIPNMVTVDGTNTPLGRSVDFPNVYGWYANTPLGDSFTAGSMTDAALPISPNLNGAEVVIRTTQWTTERRTVTHSNHTLSYSPTVYTPVANDGYFIQNHISTLNTLGDWCFTSGVLYMYFGAVNPTTKTVKISTLDSVISNAYFDYVDIKNISISGANVAGIYLLDADYGNIVGCNSSFCGQCGISGENCDYVSVNLNTIDNNNDYGIYFNNSNNITIGHNLISNSGIINGMGGSADTSSTGICVLGNYCLTTYNTILYSGYDGIRWEGQGSEVSYNVIDGYCMNKADGGAIYSYRDYNTNKTIRYNICLNGMSQPYGYYELDAYGSHGIYLDGARNITVEGNIVAHTSGRGIFINATSHIIATNNTCYDNYVEMSIHSETGEFVAHGLDVRNNILFAKENFQQTMWAVSTVSITDVQNLGVIDFNAHIRPIDNDNYIFSAVRGGAQYDDNIVQWRARYGYDMNGISSPTTINNSNTELHFIYNDTEVNKTWSISSPMIDSYGITYSNNVTLTPFTSLILIGVGTVTNLSSTIPSLTTDSVTSITPTSAISGGNITSDGGATVIARGVCWSTSINPTIANSITSNGVGIGSFISSISGLSPTTIYHVRAYATNSVGTAYGNDIQFVTTSQASLPTVTTSSNKSSNYTTANVGGEVINEGGVPATRGICYATHTTPTISDSVQASNATGTGLFTVTLTGLTPNTTYYARAYATNSAGTSYGAEISVTTLALTTPGILINNITSITQTTAVSGGSIVDDGGTAITAKGVCWSTSPTPTIALATKTNNGSGSTAWSSNITGLTANTLYYVRAYATNSTGTGYSSQSTFTSGPTTPTVTTSSVSGNGSNGTAITGGTIVSNGGSAIIAKGVCWGTSHSPTLSDSFTNDGSGSSSYVSTISGLQLGVDYYIRAYATNSLGTSYGNEYGIFFAGTNWIAIPHTKVNKTAVYQPPAPQGLLDLDGNQYTTVTIGTQEWIVENFKCTKYSNGSSISYITDNTTWSTTINGAYCWPNNDINNKNDYGALYNYYAINNVLGLAYLERNGIQENGWRVPIDTDYQALRTYLGGTSVCGGKMKESGFTHWDVPNTGANNISGYTALGAGHRWSDGSFLPIRKETKYWNTGTLWGPTQRTAFILSYTLEEGTFNVAGQVETMGCSVRLVRDI